MVSPRRAWLTRGLDLLGSRRQPPPRHPEGYPGRQFDWAQGDLELFRGALRLEGRRVLDAGCGSGGKSVFFAGHGPSELVGVDAEPRSIENARRFAAVRGATRCRFEVARLEALPFESASFDLVLTTDVLEHVDRSLLPGVFSEVRRVLRPGGEWALYFPPWTSFDASHLSHEVPLPWCQLLLGEPALSLMVKRAHEADPAKAESVMEHYRALNRLTISEFEDLAAEHRLKKRFYRHRVIKDLPVPRSFPLAPYLTKRVVAILEKV